MRRRDVVALFGGIPVFWSHFGAAQPYGVMRRVGVLIGSQKDTEAQRLAAVIPQRFAELGWMEGHDLALEFRWAPDGDPQRKAARELIELGPDAILGVGTPVYGLARETRTIPIVFVRLFDPVETGLVTSLPRPGGNITGFTVYDSLMSGKWVELLREVAGHLSRAGIVHYPETKSQALMVSGVSAAALSLGMRAVGIGVHDAAEIEQALNGFASEPNGGIVALPSPVTISNRALVIALATRHRMPAIYPFRFFAAEGGLMSYGADLAEQYRQGVTYIDRILKGAQVGDLPVQQASKFELVINLNTAKALGLIVPQSLLARANEVIE